MKILIESWNSHPDDVDGVSHVEVYKNLSDDEIKARLCNIAGDTELSGAWRDHVHVEIIEDGVSIFERVYKFKRNYAYREWINKGCPD